MGEKNISRLTIEDIKTVQKHLFNQLEEESTKNEINELLFINENEYHIWLYEYLYKKLQQLKESNDEKLSNSGKIINEYLKAESAKLGTEMNKEQLLSELINYSLNVDEMNQKKKKELSEAIPIIKEEIWKQLEGITVINYEDWELGLRYALMNLLENGKDEKVEKAANIIIATINEEINKQSQDNQALFKYTYDKRSEKSIFAHKLNNLLFVQYNILLNDLNDNLKENIEEQKNEKKDEKFMPTEEELDEIIRISEEIKRIRKQRLQLEQEMTNLKNEEEINSEMLGALLNNHGRRK